MRETSEPAAVTRRRLFGITAGTAATVVAAGAPASAQDPATRRTAPAPALDAEGAWRKLAEGNRRFVTGQQTHPHESLRWRESLVRGQHPFAVVLGCADSRVPPELVFDHGLGDLFTIRAAGEVLDNSVLGSVEYAVEHLGIPLVVVLGHANCGAVSAAVDVVRGRAAVSGDVSVLVRAIEPAVLSTPADADEARFLAAAVDNQARRVASLVLERSVTIRTAVRHHGVRVVAASYRLDTGEVTRLT
ncbi:carbonic anhydrase [Saccharothrix carnea]|uniref:Carbonic anhydrase n=1 Tax=Saccharothrix carnea TaxID=1280637 RepID=A0A2P8IGF3_SACCR|nr:carbonic anhydrase [Saccharothrix carnea]PSL57548.1 carbonic anhydrase [Saccharothrix carnea]